VKIVNKNLNGFGRRTLRMIDQYPEPKELYEKIIDPKTDWNYSTAAQLSNQTAKLLARDKALAATLYNAELRISEAERLTKNQFKQNPFRIVAMKLSKSEKRMRTMRDNNGELISIPEGHKDYGRIITRKDLYRKEIRLPTKGYRGKLSLLIQEYLDLIESEESLLFNIGNSRVDQIIKNKLGVPPHWLRAYGENLIYHLWDNDLLSAAKHVQVDPRTFALYVHGTPEKYLNRE
jgi:hypothetical protein